ncbi:YSIRK-type signal peptide-containing protein [Staphylococcus pragensis]|uniref:YSIRK-type signal peptide-containing protein n=1 Tax=Staphylococcus pragensis TaxID=1611836 RepID=A0A4Z1BXX3_9STAP|nr:YSIRK-type signal peptide-containing protein [Staphylococcus pragensis]RTX89975.1 YSIRK-type signal peptide-containing protein [Staphylococcus carnosus]TGN27415.1 YSIRK-type signal peptide-containing protein [Staphylococcus pragensis]GGG92889.1 hypothetical protein GCM10007342_14710 [Staphylococcus pragensis]
MIFNNKQRFGIRKFTIGISSILLGSVLFIGVDSVAHASELNDTNNSSHVNSPSTSNPTDDNQPNETNQSAPLIDSSANAANNDKELNNNDQLNSTNNSQSINHSEDTSDSYNANTDNNNNESDSYNTNTETTNSDSNLSPINNNQQKHLINADRFKRPQKNPNWDVSSLLPIGGGGVDVTPGLSTFKDDGNVNYNFTVSLSPIKSSDHMKTGKTFGITVPKFVQNVQFKLIGTREEETLVPHNVNLTLGQISEEDYKKTNKFNLIPTYEEYLKLKNAGKNELPSSVIKYDESNNYFSGGTYNPDYAKSYGVSTLIDGSIGLNVSFDITKEQFKKTPYLPLDARLRWKSIMENYPIDCFENGSQPLDNFRHHISTFFIYIY